jgi:hypothetical protein
MFVKLKRKTKNNKAQQEIIDNLTERFKPVLQYLGIGLSTLAILGLKTGLASTGLPPEIVDIAPEIADIILTATGSK